MTTDTQSSAGVRIPVQYVSSTSPVVMINYSDLDANNDLSQVIETAYGYDGLGIMVIKGVPDFQQLRQNLLPLAYKFARLPADVKSQYEDEASLYGVGWSHGKENLDGKPDWRKGSYYGNPLYDTPLEDPEQAKKYPYFYAQNIWPREHLPELEPAFKQLGALIIDTGLKLAKHTDRHIQSKVSTYKTDKLHNIIRTCRIAKARLLHYFPCDEPIPGQEETVNTESKDDAESHSADASDFASWCGWHNDHGSLTGLTPAMYIDNRTGLECASPSPDNGLYIRSRLGKVVKAVIPSDCLAFQMGESQQIHSGGVVQATPHCVHATSDPKIGAGISRETFALFMEPMPDEPMNVPEGCDPEKAREGTSTKYLPRGVPALGVRWSENDDFGKFTERSVNAYTVKM